MKKRTKLTQEQLKAVLQGWKTTLLACCVWDIGEYFSDEHVYTQIEELIEDSGVDEVAQRQQKPTVTREVLNEHASALVDRIADECGLTRLQRIGIFHLLTEKGDLEDIYFDVGVEVVEPETIH